MKQSTRPLSLVLAITALGLAAATGACPADPQPPTDIGSLADTQDADVAGDAAVDAGQDTTGPQDTVDTKVVATPCSSEIDPKYVFAATEEPFGTSHVDWQERYLQWNFSLPKATHPSAGGDCTQGQPGQDVWFLGNSPSFLADHTCTIPSDRALVVPIEAQLAAMTPEYDCGCLKADGSTDDVCLTDWMEDEVDLAAWDVCLEVDGKAVGSLADLRGYLKWTGPFNYTVDATDPKISLPGTVGPNNCGVTEGTNRDLMSWGYFLVLKPLPVGEHVVRWYSQSDEEYSEPAGVTLQLTVE